MGEQQRVALIISQAMAAMIKAMGMQAENDRRAVMGDSPAYTEVNFLNLIDEHGLDCNTIVNYLKDGN